MHCGKEFIIEDLYAQNFDPVINEIDFDHYWRNENSGEYEERLTACRTLIFIYPTWNYGFPAILKGYFDKIFRPNISFTVRGGRIQYHHLSNVKSAIFITSFGASKEENFPHHCGIEDYTIRYQMGRLFASDCNIIWKPVYGLDRCGIRERSDLARKTVVSIISLLKN
jgi:putative NADPH-quinone reductase